jgi:hypothetical protein
MARFVIVDTQRQINQALASLIMRKLSPQSGSQIGFLTDD